MRRVNVRDLLGGGLLLVLGVGAAVQSAQYDIGSLRRMGPGYFPLVLGIILAATGLLMILGSLRAVVVQPLVWRADWRGWACICLGVAAFAVLGRYGGLVPATFAAVFIAAMGERANSWVASLMLAGVMTVVGVVVFWWLLKVQLPLFGWG